VNRIHMFIVMVYRYAVAAEVAWFIGFIESFIGFAQNAAVRESIYMDDGNIWWVVPQRNESRADT
jgi:hypothetical protein